MSKSLSTSRKETTKKTQKYKGGKVLMMREFFHHKSKDDTVDSSAIKHVELSDEQLKQVSGGYIADNPQGESDWQKRQDYEKTHPGIAVPLLSFH
jgi:bacteriocin-like protein